MLSPIYLPDDYSGYMGEEKEMIAKAVDDADVELGPIQRFSVKSVTRYDSEWVYTGSSSLSFFLFYIEAHLWHGLEVFSF